MEERNLSLSTVAGSLGVSERTIRRWIKAGKLRAYRPGRDYRIPESALRQLVEESEISPKGLRPSSPELSFEELMEAEMRGGATDADLLEEYEAVTRNYRLAFRKAIEGLVAPWQERLRTGAFDRSMVEQFFSDCYALSEGIALALSTVTVENLLQVKYKPPPTSEDVEEMWASSIAPAAVSLMDLSADLWDAAVERFAQDELAEARRMRDEMWQALGRAA